MNSQMSMSTPGALTGTVIKLRVNEIDGIRRIPAYRLVPQESVESIDKNPFHRDRSVFDYRKLRDCAIEYSEFHDGNIQSEGVVGASYDVRLTYVDEEGDIISMSTDMELSEAIFHQWQLRREREEEEEGEENGAAFEMIKTADREEEPPMNTKSKRCASLHIQAVVEPKSPHRAKETYQPSGRPPHSPLSQAVDAIVSSISSAVQRFKEHNEQHGTNANRSASARTPRNNGTEGYDADFVHQRHRCDCCGITPIAGYRYHAVHIPNFDLCAVCVEKVDLPEVEFRLTQNKPDRIFKYPAANRPNLSFFLPKPKGRTQNVDSDQIPSHEIEAGIARSLEELKSKHQHQVDVPTEMEEEIINTSPLPLKVEAPIVTEEQETLKIPSSLQENDRDMVMRVLDEPSLSSSQEAAAAMLSPEKLPILMTNDKEEDTHPEDLSPDFLQDLEQIINVDNEYTGSCHEQVMGKEDDLKLYASTDTANTPPSDIYSEKEAESDLLSLVTAPVTPSNKVSAETPEVCLGFSQKDDIQMNDSNDTDSDDDWDVVGEM